MRIGHRSANLGLPMMDAIDAAGEIGYEGVALLARVGWVDPADLGPARVAEIRERCARAGVEVSALTGGFGSLIGAGADERVPWCRSVLEAAAELEVSLVTSHIGAIPEDLSGPEVRAMMERVGTLCARAQELGVTIGAETGPEEPRVLRGFIEALGSPRLRVNYDPANLLMKGFDHLGGVEVLGPYIVHTHPKDAVRTDPDGKLQRALGEGEVDLPRWIGELKRVGFDGWLCVERESGEDKLGDARRALALLRALI